MTDIYETNGNEKGVTITTFVVVVGFIFFFIAGAAAWVVVSDRFNGLDAYRVRELRQRGDDYKNQCEFNAARLQSLQEWIRQNNYKPDPNLIQLKQCQEQKPIEGTSQH